MKAADALALAKLAGIVGVAGFALYAGWRVYKGAAAIGDAVGDAFGSVGDAIGGAVDYVAELPGRAVDAGRVAIAGGGDPDFYTSRFDPESPTSKLLAQQQAEWDARFGADMAGSIDPFTGQLYFAP